MSDRKELFSYIESKIESLKEEMKDDDLPNTAFVSKAEVIRELEYILRNFK